MKKKIGYCCCIFSIVSAIIFVLIGFLYGLIISFIVLMVSIDLIVIKDSKTEIKITKIIYKNKKAYLMQEDKTLQVIKTRIKKTKYGKITVVRGISNFSPFWKQFCYYQRRKVTSSLRAEVMHRDKFTCQHCGAKAPNVEIHIDHIYPISKGGISEINNLQTLCKNCNLGKKNKYVD